MKAWIASILATIFKDIAYDFFNWVVDYFKLKKQMRDQTKSNEQAMKDAVKAGSDPGLTDAERMEQQKKAHEDYLNSTKP